MKKLSLEALAYLLKDSPKDSIKTVNEDSLKRVNGFVEPEYTSPFTPGEHQSLARYRTDPQTLKEFQKAPLEMQIAYMLDPYSGPAYSLFDQTERDKLKQAISKKDTLLINKVITDYFQREKPKE